MSRHHIRHTIGMIACLLCSGILLSACRNSPQGVPAASVPPVPAATATVATDSAEQRYPDILEVRLSLEDTGSYRIDVTVSSPYDTPERYADAWRVLAPDGRVLGERILLHDHAGEQPFTRSLSGVTIPPEVTRITVEGRDSRYGYGGTRVSIDVPR